MLTYLPTSYSLRAGEHVEQEPQPDRTYLAAMVPGSITRVPSCLVVGLGLGLGLGLRLGLGLGLGQGLAALLHEAGADCTT